MSDVGTPVDAPVAAPIATPEPVSTAEQVVTPEGESPEAPVEERSFKQSEVDKIVQTRLAKESRRLQRVAEAEARAAYAERQLAELRAPAKSEQPSGEPVPQNFKDYESYISALTDWKVDQKMQGLRQETEAQQYARQKAEQAEKVMPKLKSAQEKYDDFNEVALTYTAPPAMQAAMLRSPHTGELYYYLGANPEEREKISRLDDVEQIYAIRDLERKLTAPPKPTNTPPPIVPSEGKAPVKKDIFDFGNDDPAAFKKFCETRRKEIGRR